MPVRRSLARRWLDLCFSPSHSENGEDAALGFCGGIPDNALLRSRGHAIGCAHVDQRWDLESLGSWLADRLRCRTDLRQEQHAMVWETLCPDGCGPVSDSKGICKNLLHFWACGISHQPGSSTVGES